MYTMRIVLSVCFVVYFTSIYAQNFSEKGTVYLSGHIENFKEKFFELDQTGFFTRISSSILVDSVGGFSHTLQIEGKQQDLYLALNNDIIVITVKDRDSLEINWDANNFKNTLKIKSSSPTRQNLLNLQLYEYFNFSDPFFELQDSLYKNRDKLSSNDKYQLINSLFNKQINDLAIQSNNNITAFQTLYTNLYYQFANFISSYHLPFEYKLKPILDTINIKNTDYRLAINRINRTTLIDGEFWSSVNYRDFLFDYIRFAGQSIFNGYVGTSSVGFDPTLDAYYMSKALIPSSIIQDWFNVKNILFSFIYYDFNKTENVYHIVSKELKDTTLKNVLDAKYLAALTLKPGIQAPAFTLKDDNGNDISLSNFKGKVVYMDFWGVTCGVCIYDIESYSAKLHEKYKDKDVVFISICVDANEQEWKKALNKYKMHDQINLIAEGWVEHPMVKKYNVQGIPHYFLIGKDGAIINNNARGMDELLNTVQNEVDKALKQ